MKFASSSMQNFGKIFLVLLIPTAIIAFFSLGISYVSDFIFGSEKRFNNEVKIASVDVHGLDSKEAYEKLSEAIAEWTATVPVTFYYKENKAEGENLFHFDIDASIHNALSANTSQTELSVSINELELDGILAELSFQDLASKVDKEQLKQKLLSHAGHLLTTPLEINVYEFLYPEYADKEQVLSKAVVKNFEKKVDLVQLANEVNNYVIEPQTTFSLHEVLEKASIKSDYSASVIATGIYQAILPTNFEIVERNTSLELPPYSELGFEVSVDKNADLKFYNPNLFSYTLKTEIKGEELHVSLVGIPFENKYIIVKRNEQTYNPKTIVQYSEDLSPSARTVLEEGKKGFSVEIVRKMEDPHGNEIESIVLFADFYRPTHRVELRGVPVAQTQETPEETGLTNEDGNEGAGGEEGSSEQPNGKNAAGTNERPGSGKGEEKNAKRGEREPDVVK